MKNMKRKSRKNCIYSRGISYYNFDFNKEFTIYKYLCGEKLTKRQWKYLNEDNSFDFYRDWEHYVRQKYQNYNTDKLNEFCRYIEHIKRTEEPQIDYWKVAFSAIVSYIIIDGVKEISDEISVLNNLVENVLSGIIVLFTSIILYVIAFGSMILLLLAFIEKIFSGNLERYFLEDYNNILQKLLMEKNM